MCTSFAHAMLGLTAAVCTERALGLRAAGLTTRWRWIAAACAALPDIDAGLHAYGVDADSIWGHRGFLHSIAFACIVGGLVSWLCFKPLDADAAPERRGWRSPRRWALAAVVSLITASHGMLDALTDGGHGIAFFAPFSDARYHAPWNPFPVPMMGLTNLFTAYMLEVLMHELLLVIVPCGVILLVQRLLGRRAAPSAGGAA
jgi:inner membrane protein